MKNLMLVILITLISIPAFSQENQPETLFGTEDVRIGGYGGPEVKFTGINNEFGLLVGGRGGLLVNSVFTVGIAGYGLVTSHPVPDYKIIPYRSNDSSAYLRMGYGGLHLGFIIEPNKVVHITAGVLIGAGGAAYTSAYWKGWDDNNYENTHHTYESSAFFIAEPQIGAELNLLKFMRMELSASYRYVSLLDLSKTQNKDLSGFSGNIMFKFGKF